MKSRRRRGLEPAFSQINVTPLVDVMLVLLIVFMITAPLMSTTSVVEIPSSGDGEKMDAGAPELFVDTNGEWRQGSNKGRHLEAKELVDWLNVRLDSAENRGEPRVVFIHGDKGASHGALLDLIKTLRKIKREEGVDIKSISLVIDEREFPVDAKQ